MSRRITMYNDWDRAVCAGVDCAGVVWAAAFGIAITAKSMAQAIWRVVLMHINSYLFTGSLSLIPVTLNRRKVHCSIQRGNAIQQASRTIGKHRPWVKYNEIECKPCVVTHQGPILRGFFGETGLQSTCRRPFRDLCFYSNTFSRNISKANMKPRSLRDLRYSFLFWRHEVVPFPRTGQSLSGY